MTILDWIYGIRLASADEITDALCSVVESIDEDKDGQISVGEFVKAFKKALKELKNGKK